MSKTPHHWYHRGGIDKAVTTILKPISFLYGLGQTAHSHLRKQNALKPDIKIICIGNAVAGGAGKTPTALAVAALLPDDCNACYMTRGYGGSLKGPGFVTEDNNAIETGDEPLLLVRQLPTIVAKNRKDGIHIAKSNGFDVIIMDDGLQNTSIEKDFSLLVIDGAVGVGNGELLPAGPLREPLSKAIDKTNAVLIIGTDETEIHSVIPNNIPTFTANTVPDISKIELGNQNYLAFTGLGRPQKFKDILEQIDITLTDFIGFPDHYFYTEKDLLALEKKARQKNARLLTTEKDHVRLNMHWKEKITFLPVHLEFNDIDALQSTLHKAIS